MKLEHWQDILRTYRQVRVSLDQFQLFEPTAAQTASQVRVGAQGLALLHQQLLTDVEGLQRALGSTYSEEEVREAVRPFVYLIDEMVMQRLADDDHQDWTKLQKTLYQLDSGGDHFYELADEKLGQRGGSLLLFELMHFCLTAGFEGGHQGKPARLREYKERLAARIPRPEITPAPPPAAATTPLLHAFPWRYYGVSAVVVMTVPVLLWWLSQ